MLANRPRTTDLLVVLINFFNLVLFLLLFFLLDLALDFLFDNKLDRVRDELRVLLDDVLDALLLEVLQLVLLHVQTELSTTTDRFAFVNADGESTTSSRFPDVLLIVVVLGDDLDSVGNQEGGVKTDTELTD